MTAHHISNSTPSLLAGPWQVLTVSELEQRLRLLGIETVDTPPRRMVDIEPDHVCQLEHFLRGELEGGVGTPFERYVDSELKPAANRSYM